MMPELSRWVSAASGVATSGRWAALNERITWLCSHCNHNDRWWVRLFAGLAYQTFTEYSLLRRAYEHGEDASVLAWRARNLLELSIWSVYCSKSRGNARVLYEDAGRDVHGIMEAFEKWAVATSCDAGSVATFAEAKLGLSKQAQLEGIHSLEGEYKKVHAAAKEVGLHDHFKIMYRTLSKFAHPTAMQILALPDDAKTAKQRESFFSQGCLYFGGSFEALERSLLSK